MQCKLFRYDANIDADAPDQSLMLRVNGPELRCHYRNHNESVWNVFTATTTSESSFHTTLGFIHSERIWSYDDAIHFYCEIYSKRHERSKHPRRRRTRNRKRSVCIRLSDHVIYVLQNMFSRPVKILYHSAKLLRVQLFTSVKILYQSVNLDRGQAFSFCFCHACELSLHLTENCNS